MMEHIEDWVRGPRPDWARPSLEGSTPTNSLAVPMMLLALVNQLVMMDRELEGAYTELTEYCVKALLDHIQVSFFFF